MPWKEKPFGWGKEFAGEALFPAAQGATVAILDQLSAIVEQDSSIREMVFHLDHVEPPSVELAIQLVLDQLNSGLKFACQSDGKLVPDPRASSANLSLWKFERERPVPAVDKPAQNYVDACVEIAAEAEDCFDSWNRVGNFSRLNDMVDVDSWLAVMVHPPKAGVNFSAVSWVRRIQLAAAQFAVAIELQEKISIGGSKVADVTRGPIDWTVDAALVALAQRTRSDRASAEKVRELVDEVLQRIPSAGTWSSKAVAQSVLRYLELSSCEESAKESSSSNR